MPEDRLELSGVKLIFKNFTGLESQFNAKGKRNFCVVLDPEYGAQLKAEGWNVRYLEGRMEGELPQPYLQVAVSFNSYPPNVNLISGKKLVHLNEDTIGTLDWAEIKNVDLVIRPYNWEMNGKRGTKAYLKSMFVTIEEDPFAQKYADLVDDSEPQMRQAFNTLMEEGA